METLSEATRQERKKALRKLLKTPLIRASSHTTEEFDRIRRHASWLRDWVVKNLGWTLHVDNEVARLWKTPSLPVDGTYPALSENPYQLPFTRKRYVLLCLILAALERSERQTTLGKLADEVAQLIDDPVFEKNGITLDLSIQNHRRDVVQGLRFLLDLQILTSVQGDELGYLNDRESDVLYTVQRNVLSRILNVKRGPSMVNSPSLEDRILAITEEYYPDNEEGWNRRVNHSLMRRLINHPILYYSELNEKELRYLHSQRSRILRQLEEATGLIPEIRQEGIALLDEDGELTDFGMPEEGTDGHLTLLIAEYLSQAHQKNDESAMTLVGVQAHVRKLIVQYRSYWRKDVGEPRAEIVLTEMALQRLENLRLLKREGEKVIPLPAIGRFALDHAILASQTSLSIG